MNNDLISRQAAIEAVVDALKRIPTAAILAKNAIENVPVAEVCEDAVSREAALRWESALRAIRRGYER